ncbi:multidrug effflux MFS transporter [Gemella cuniculi]|uniref:multidrug effflux MFS transporter n=1 Tax=Gemella cuniculi TaxID=150240 RepID=UPI0004014349|nr:multidrug effflux MFS transporter [Gemella cuniculi]
MKNSTNSILFLIILGGFMAFSSIATDIYLSAMPTIQKQLGGNVEFTITGFLIGFMIAQLFWGVISDRIGRKIPLTVGTIIFILGSIICAISPNMSSLFIGRIIQALGACVGPMLSRAMVRDLYSSKEAAKMLSTLMIIMAIAPIVGPLLGGLLLKIGSWRLIFWLVAFIGLIMLVSVRFLPETLRKENRHHESMNIAFRHYIELLTHKKFMLYTLSVTFFYVAAYAFITDSSKIYINYFNIKPEYYGFLFGINIIGLVIVSSLNRFLLNRFTIVNLLKFATSFAFLISLLLVICGVGDIGGILGIIIPMFLIFSMNGIIAACSNAAALNRVRGTIAGSAAALIGSLQYGSGIISSILLAIFSDGSPSVMVIIISVFTFLSALMVWFVKE